MRNQQRRAAFSIAFLSFAKGRTRLYSAQPRGTALQIHDQRGQGKLESNFFIIDGHICANCDALWTVRLMCTDGLYFIMDHGIDDGPHRYF